MNNTHDLFKKFRNLAAIGDDEQEFIERLFQNKIGMAWCAGPLSLAKTLGEALAVEFGMNIHDNEMLQKNLGLFSIAEKSSLFFFEEFESSIAFRDSILGICLQLYGDEALKVISENVFKNISFLIRFDERSFLQDITEIKSSEGKVFMTSIFSNHRRTYQSGSLPENEKLWISKWKKTKSKP